jgi:hypothetical protein
MVVGLGLLDTRGVVAVADLHPPTRADVQTLISDVRSTC